MKKLFFLLSLCLVTHNLLAQPNLEWQRALGGSSWDVMKAVQQTFDGGYIVAGEAKSTDGDVSMGHGVHDLWVVKLSVSGNIEWEKTYGGSAFETANAILLLDDGGYLIGGVRSSTDGDLISQPGDGGCWLLKISALGDLEWQKTYGGSGTEAIQTLIQTNDGGYAFTGRSASNDGDASENHGLSDFWVVKLDHTGIVEWQKSIGGSSEDWPSFIGQLADNGYVVAGSSISSDGDISMNHGKWDGWVVKLSSSGTLEWEKTFGGSQNDLIYEGSINQEGDVLLVGNTDSNDGDIYFNHGSVDAWIIKLKGDGELDWSETYGNSGTDNGRLIQNTSDGSIIMGGITHGNLLLMKLSETGAIIWEKNFGCAGSETPFSMVHTNDLGYIMASSISSDGGDVTGYHGGDSDGWVVKLSADLVGANNISNFQDTGKLQISPNPGNDVVHLTLNTLETPLTIRIFDPLGRPIIQKDMEHESDLNVLALPNGLYTLHCVTITGKIYTEKLYILRQI